MTEVFDVIFEFCLTVGFYLFVIIAPAWLVWFMWKNTVNSYDWDKESMDEDAEKLAKRLRWISGKRAGRKHEEQKEIRQSESTESSNGNESDGGDDEGSVNITVRL